MKSSATSSSSEEELKIPILNNNYEGFKEVEECHSKLKDSSEQQANNHHGFSHIREMKQHSNAASNHLNQHN